MIDTYTESPFASVGSSAGISASLAPPLYIIIKAPMSKLEKQLLFKRICP